MNLDVVQTLAELVAIPSVNPMGRPLKGADFFEHRVTQYLEDLFQRLHVPTQRQAIEPQRENIVAAVEGDPRRVLLLEAHQDTVPVDGMTIPPFLPEIRNGRMYGRGSCDIKGGMAAMLGAFARIADRPRESRPTLILACTVNEEHGYSGANELGQLWATGSRSIVPRRPDAAIVAEPTGLDVVVAHKGAVRWKCHARGRATHSSQPHLGDNAIFTMARAIAALEKYAAQEAPRVPPHKLCGQATLSVGTIQGGISVNTVPDVCTIEIDRRVVPGETVQSAYEHVLAYLRRQPGVDGRLEHEPPYLQGAPLSDGENLPLARSLSAVVRELFGRGEIRGVPFGTNASKVAAAGVPAVVFGPGSIDQAHTADEWLDLAELQQASEAIFQFALRWDPASA